jgi:hypothetical protein
VEKQWNFKLCLKEYCSFPSFEKQSIQFKNGEKNYWKGSVDLFVMGSALIDMNNLSEVVIQKLNSAGIKLRE